MSHSATEQDPRLYLVFVCTGNICRSPMAESVLRERLRATGLADTVRVSSAGVGAWHVGEPMDPRAAETLARHGFPTPHRAAQVGPEHLDADLLLAMDHGHEKALRRLVDDPERIRMFRRFDPAAGRDLDVPDPYFGGADGFETVFAMIETATAGLLDWVRTRVEP